VRHLTGRFRYVPETTNPAKLLRVEDSARRPAVAILGASGAVIQVKVGALIEDGTRCRLQHEGKWVDAIKQETGWAYSPPVETDNDD
jgi:hypothetical protein